MAEIMTHFPPQTYSSTFFLNSFEDEENEFLKHNKKSERNEDTNGIPPVDCFLTTFLFREKQEKPLSKSKGKKLKQTKQTSNKDVAVSDGIWKNSQISKYTSMVRPEFPHSTLKELKKTTGLNLLESKHQNGYKIAFQTRNAEEDMSLLKFLAINALDLSAPATDILLKNYSSDWFQLSGHPDSLAPAGPGTVWKKRSGGIDDTERIVYEQLAKDPLLYDIVPKYYREVEYQGEKFIELEDLLHSFQDPYVVDIKMGTRTFLESEVKKKTARSDLYQKMFAIDPSALTKEEHEKKTITKLRYMQFRELQSSTCSHGFRIEAMKCRGSPPVTDLKKVKSNDEICATLNMFLDGNEVVREKLLERLSEIRNKIEISEFFKIHEVVGASLFIIYDDLKVGIWLIDFAKTNRLPNGMTVDHRKPWVQGNHEEGLLFGFDRLISILETISSGSNLRSSFPSANNI